MLLVLLRVISLDHVLTQVWLGPQPRCGPSRLKRMCYGNRSSLTPFLAKEKGAAQVQSKYCANASWLKPLEAKAAKE